MSVSEPLSLARISETSDSKQFINCAHAPQQNSARISLYDSGQLPAIGTPAFTAWARHDSVVGHARNALTLIRFLEPDTFSDPETVDTLRAIERRCAAMLELLAVLVPTSYMRPLGASPMMRDG